MTKMEQKREEKRAAILLAALEVFFAQGYVGASMDAIASEAGVTKQTVYRYYGSKEELYQAALESRREGGGNHFLAELGREDPGEALTRFAEGFLGVHMAKEHLAAIRLLVAEGPEAPEMTRAFYAVGPRRTEERLVRFMEERLGADDPQYAAKMFIATLLSMRMSVLVGLAAAPTPEDVSGHARRTARMFLKLMG